MELHHIVPESNGGKSTFENCIPLCFDCHADAGHYNPKHPKGTKYSPTELKKHRDNWYSAIRQLTAEEALRVEQAIKANIEVYEGQEIELIGFVWREAFPGPPNYESFETDSIETYWMFVLPEEIALFTSDLEYGGIFKIEGIKKLQLLVNPEFYKENKHIVLTNINIKGKLYCSRTGHHHGDALFEVISFATESLGGQI